MVANKTGRKWQTQKHGRLDEQETTTAGTRCTEIELAKRALAD